MPQTDPVGRRKCFGEDIAVKIYLLKIREHGLPVLHHGKACPDPRDVPCRVVQVVENQIGKINECVVIDPAVKILALQSAVPELCFRLPSLVSEHFHLEAVQAQLQLLDVVQGIADLMGNAQGNQHIRCKVCIHVGVQVRSELAGAQDIRLDHGLGKVEVVVLGLAHQGLGNGRNACLAFHPSIGKDVCHLGIPETEDIDFAVVAVNIAGNHTLDDLHPVMVIGKREITDMCKVRDQVSCLMVRRPENIGKLSFLVHVQINDDILLLVQVEPSGICHVPSPLCIQCTCTVV